MEEEENKVLPVDLLLEGEEPAEQAGPRVLTLFGDEPTQEEEVVQPQPTPGRRVLNLFESETSSAEPQPPSGPRTLNLFDETDQSVEVTPRETPQPARIHTDEDDPLNFSEKTIAIFQGLQEAVQEIGRPLTDQDFFDDERLQAAVRHQVITRRDATTPMGRTGSWLAGGATFGGSQNYEDMPFEELFPMWKN